MIQRFLLTLMFVAASTAVALAQTTVPKVGVNTRTPTEPLHVAGTLRVEQLPTQGQPNATFTKPDGSASATKDQSYTSRYVVTASEQGVLGRASGAQPNFFYMPPMVVPTDPSVVAAPITSYDAGTQTYSSTCTRNMLRSLGAPTRSMLSLRPRQHCPY